MGFHSSVRLTTARLWISVVIVLLASCLSESACVSVRVPSRNETYVDCDIILPIASAPFPSIAHFDQLTTHLELELEFLPANDTEVLTAADTPSYLVTTTSLPLPYFLTSIHMQSPMIDVTTTPGGIAIPGVVSSFSARRTTAVSLDLECVMDGFSWFTIKITVAKDHKVVRVFSLYFVKACAVKRDTCTNTTGTASVTHPGLCDCKPSYYNALLPYDCSLGVDIYPPSICPTDTVRLAWLKNATNADDHLAILPPSAPDPALSPLHTSLMKPVAKAYFFRSVSMPIAEPVSTPGVFPSPTTLMPPIGSQWGWFSVPMLVNQPGKYEIVIYSKSGPYVRSLSFVEVKPIEHPSCLSRFQVAIPISCVNGVQNVKGTCDCFPGFYGYRCEHGCGGVNYITEAGKRLRNSASGNPLYMNNQNCTWVLKPRVTWPVTAFTYSFSAIHLQDDDYVAVYRGSRITESALMGKYSRLVVGAYAAMDVNYTTAMPITANDTAITIHFSTSTHTPGMYVSIILSIILLRTAAPGTFLCELGDVRLYHTGCSYLSVSHSPPSL